MKVSENLALALVMVIQITGCGSEFYTKKELRNQTVPAGLQNKTWQLRKIYSKRILESSDTWDFNNSNGTQSCPFTFRFADQGELIMTFRQETFKGVYLISGNRFKYIHEGFLERIVWTGDPECAITPTQLGYVFNGRQFQFKIKDDTLTLSDKESDLMFTANN
jgi:hypothetical protein